MARSVGLDARRLGRRAGGWAARSRTVVALRRTATATLGVKDGGGSSVQEKERDSEKREKKLSWHMRMGSTMHLLRLFKEEK